MALPPVAGVVKCTLGWKVGADTTAQNVLHFRYSGGASGADLAAGATAIASVLSGDMGLAAVFGTHVTLETVTLTDLSSMAAPHGEATIALVGTRTGGALSSGSAALINLIIARRYRGGKPRSYMPWGTSTDLDSSNHWTSVAISGFESQYDSLVAAIIANSGPVSMTAQCNVGYFSGYTLGPAQPGGFRKKIPTPLGTPHNDLVNDIAMSPNVGSQRRRNRA